MTAAGLVAVPCSVLHAGATSLLVSIHGVTHMVWRRDVADWSDAGVVVPEAVAADLTAPPLADTLTDADVAKALKKSVDWVYRNIMSLVAEEGFPAPVSRRGRRRYAREDVAAWLRRDRSAAAALEGGQDAAETAARSPRRPARAAAPAHFSEPPEHGQRAAEETAAWRAAIADAYGRPA